MLFYFPRIQDILLIILVISLLLYNQNIQNIAVMIIAGESVDGDGLTPSSNILLWNIKFWVKINDIKCE